MTKGFLEGKGKGRWVLEDFENNIRAELHKVTALVGMMLECKTDETPAKVPPANQDHFLLFGFVEECFTRIAGCIGGAHDRPDLADLHLYSTELETHFRMLRHQAGMAYFDRPAAISLAHRLVKSFVEMADEAKTVA